VWRTKLRGCSASLRDFRSRAQLRLDGGLSAVNLSRYSRYNPGMMTDEALRKLILKWTAESEAYRAEAQRLERSDQSRHATSITMLEARSQALEHCILDVETLGRG
jgi:hypothetical protein